MRDRKTKNSKNRISRSSADRRTLPEIFTCTVTCLIGMMSVLFNLQNTDVLRISFTLLFAVSAAAVVIFSAMPRRVLYSTGVAVLVYGALRSRVLVKAIIFFANDVYDTLYNGRLASLGADELAEQTAPLTELLVYLCVLIAWLIIINVRCIKSLFVSLVLMFALPVIYSSALVIPSGWIWVLGLAYVVGTVVGAVMRKYTPTRNYSKDNNKLSGREKFVRSGQTAVIAGEAAVLIFGGVLISCLSKNYIKPEFFYTANHKWISYIDEHLTWNIGNSGTGEGDEAEGDGRTSVINGGVLGALDSVTLNGDIAGYAVTLNTGKPQYIKTFTGGTYLNGANIWSDKASTDTQSDSYTQYIAHAKIDGETVMDIVNSTRNSKIMTMYTRDITLAGMAGTKAYSENVYEVDTRAYSTLSEISSSTQMLRADTSNLLMRVPSVVKASYSAVPVHTKEIISEITSGRSDTKAETLDDKLNAISYVSIFLMTNYKYTLSPGAVPEGTDFVEYFLTENKYGYCTYFATAATLMLRSFGIPARYVEGYMLTADELDDALPQGDTDDDTVLATIYAKDAHAWVEVFLDGIGWVNVDVTPSSGSSVPLSQIVGTNGRLNTITGGDEDELTDEDEDDLEDEDEDDEDTETDEDAQGETVLATTATVNALTARILTTVLALGSAAAIIILAVLALRRRALLRLRKLLKSNDTVALYKNITSLMKQTDMERPASMDYIEYAKNVEAGDKYFERHMFADLTETAVNVMYSGGRFTAKADSSVRKNYLGLRDYIYSKMNPVKRIYVKYILAL